MVGLDEDYDSFQSPKPVLNDRMSDEWESIWKEAIIAYLRYYLGICLD
jgi:hypothetical protein